MKVRIELGPLSLAVIGWVVWRLWKAGYRLSRERKEAER